MFYRACKRMQRRGGRHLQIVNPKEGPNVALLRSLSSGWKEEGAGDEFSSDVEKIYRILRKFHIRPANLDAALRGSGVPLRPGLLERVISRCGPSGDLSMSFFCWLSRRRPDLPPSAAAHLALLSSLARSRRFGSAWALLRRIPSDLITPDLLAPLIRRFAAARMLSSAINLLDETPDPDGRLFSCLLDALCKRGNVQQAASLFREMRYRFPPTLRDFTSLLHGWCRAGKLQEALSLLPQMTEAGFAPDLVVFNTLLAGYTSAGRMRDARALLADMPVVPNAISYTTLIHAFCSRGLVHDALSLFDEMRSRGCPPDAITYTALISGFCKAGSLDRAHAFLDAMEKPNPAAFFPFFVHHEAQEEDLNKCFELMTRMRRVNCLPDLSIYNVVIRLACKLGELKRATDVWNEMETGGLSPGLDTFVIMIHGLISQGSLVEASSRFKEMVSRGLLSAPPYGTLKELLNSLLRAAKLELAEDAWACVVGSGCELNVCAWTIWIHALFSNKYVKEACYHCLDMMDAGLMPQPDTFARLMRGLRKLYNRQIAAEITEKVRVMAAERNVTFKMYKRRGDMDLERKKLRAMQMKNGSRRRLGFKLRCKKPELMD